MLFRSLRVLTVEDSESGFVTELTVKGVKAGKTKLFVAAPGFASQELPVTVYGNVLNQRLTVRSFNHLQFNVGNKIPSG